MKECENCGSHVSRAWARVASDNDGVVHHCVNCPDSRIRGSSESGATGKDDKWDRGPDWCNVE